MNPIIKSTQRTARIGLYGSLIVDLVALALYFIPKSRFYVDNHTYALMTVGGALLTVLVTAAILLMVRRTIPRIRQLDDIGTRMENYASHIASIYRGALTVVVIDAILITLSHNSVLFMLIIILILTLIMVFPSALRMKVDLGLTDEQFDELFPQEK